jgi:hypothetical protein
MKAKLYFPKSVEEAEGIVSSVDACALDNLAEHEFIRVWCSIVFLNPGLHTDNILDPDYDCEPMVRQVLEEVWRRADIGEITEDEMYPYEVIRARLVA